MSLGGVLKKVVVAIVILLVISAASVGAALSTGVVKPEPPSVESVQNEWGDVSDERTAIRTSVVVTNPNKIGIPAVADVTYDVSMNDVTVASGSSKKLGLSAGRNEVTLQTHIDNEKIPAWWATHINNGEKTTVSVEPAIGAFSYSKELPAQERTFETDILASFNSDSGQSVEVGGQTLLTVEETSASWGEATEEETPLSFAGTVHNPNDVPIVFSKIGYTVSMNDVTVAEGTTDEGVEIAPESTETIDVDSTMDNTKLDEWWVSHLRNDENTTLDVQVYAVSESGKRIPLPFMSKRVIFETDILGGGKATTREVETDRGFDFEPPTVESVERDWQSTDSGTRFSANVVVNNPNAANSTVGDVALDASYRVALNEVTLIEDSAQTTLQPGRNEMVFEDDVSNETIKKWWISHVKNGERTSLTTESSVVADLGFATAPIALPSENRTFETDMLSGFAQTEQVVEIKGTEVATLDDMQSDWGEPTMERTPMVVTGEVTNQRDRSLTVVSFGYEVSINGVVLADNESAVETTIPGKSTRSIQTTGYLNNDKIPAWWVSHLENGERSELSVTYYAVVEMGGKRFRVALDTMSYSETIETNAFGAK